MRHDAVGPSPALASVRVTSDRWKKVMKQLRDTGKLSKQDMATAGILLSEPEKLDLVTTMLEIDGPEIFLEIFRIFIAGYRR